MRSALLFPLLAGCPAGAPECPTEGPWTWNGTCLGMSMTSTVSLEADGCTFTVGDWDMAMSTPDGGTVDGGAVTLDWSGKSDCTGTVGADGTSMEGSCGDGCTWTATFDG